MNVAAIEALAGTLSPTEQRILQLEIELANLPSTQGCSPGPYKLALRAEIEHLQSTLPHENWALKENHVQS